MAFYPLKIGLVALGTTGYTGFSPVGPGTAGAAVAAIAVHLLGPDPLALTLATALITLTSVPVSSWMERQYGKDPSCCTIDEVVGYLIPLCLLWVPLSAPGSWKVIWAGFVLFRIFDIFKPWPCRRAESLPAGWGIVMDDVLAGIYTFVVLKLLMSFVF